MQSAFFKAVCQMGIFMVCAQTITHFRPNSSYEKYLKLLVSVMMLIQIFRPISALFTFGEDWELEKRIQEIGGQLDLEMEKAAENGARAEQILEKMTLMEVQELLEGQETASEWEGSISAAAGMGEAGPQAAGEKDRTGPQDAGEKNRTKPQTAEEKDGTVPQTAEEKDGTVPQGEGEKDGTVPQAAGEKDRTEPQDEGEKERTGPQVTGEKDRTGPQATGEKNRTVPQAAGEKNGTEPSQTEDARIELPAIDRVEKIKVGQ